MNLLIAGMTIFAITHLIPSLPVIKNKLVTWLGEYPYKLIFSTIAIISLIIIIWGFSNSDFIPIYEPPHWSRHGTMLLVLLGFIAFAGYRTNGYIKKTLKHPMLIAVALWATGHLLANGDLRSIILFGGFLICAILDIILATMNKNKIEVIEPRIKEDIISLMISLLLYGLLLLNHEAIIGVKVIQFN